MYHPQTADWTDRITESTLNRLRQCCPNLKYCVTVVVAQRKGGGGVHSQISSYYSPSSDGACSLLYENDSLVCVMTIFGLAL